LLGDHRHVEEVAAAAAEALGDAQPAQAELLGEDRPGGAVKAGGLLHVVTHLLFAAVLREEVAHRLAHGQPLVGAAAHGLASPTSRPLSSRAMTSLAALAVPSPHSMPMTSRSRCSSGSSRVYAACPWISIAAWMASRAVVTPHHLAIAASAVCGRPASRSHRAR